MKKNIAITLISLIAAALLFTGCDEMELAKPGPDLTGTYIYSEQIAADETVPAYTRYYFKIEINGDYYKLYSTHTDTYTEALYRWNEDCKTVHTEQNDQWTVPLPQWFVIEQGYILNTTKSHTLNSKTMYGGTPFTYSANRNEITIDDLTYVKQDPAILKDSTTLLDGVWICGDEYAAEGGYPAYVVPRMQLIIDSKHFDLFTKRADYGKTVEETIEDKIDDWKRRYLNHGGKTLVQGSWWDKMSNASGSLEQSGSAVTLTTTHYATGWSSVDAATLMSDGTLKVRIPTEESSSYEYKYFKKAEKLPILQEIKTSMRF